MLGTQRHSAATELRWKILQVLYRAPQPSAMVQWKHGIAPFRGCRTLWDSGRQAAHLSSPFMTEPRALPLPAPRPHAGYRLVRAGLLLVLLMTLISCDGIFFQPDSERYLTPEQYGLWHEPVRFRSQDGTVLAGWFLPAQTPGRAPLGTV